MPITTRAAKGSALTHSELDANFTELASAIAFLTPTDTAYSAAVPLTGTLYMPQTAVTGAIAFTVVAGPLKGANTYLRLVANGTNTPTFTGMREWGGSSGFDNRNGIVNEIQFFNDGVDSWYSISQEVGAVAIPAAATAVSMTGPTTGVTGVASTAFSVGVTPLGGAITGTVVVTPSDAAAGGTFTPASVSLTTAAPAATFTYTPSSAGAKTISVTNNGALTNPANITYTASAAATAPGAPTIGTATGGDASASVTFTAPASNGGSAITGYTVTSSPGGLTATGASSPLNVTGLTNGTAYTFSVTATNAIGTGTASAASNSVTPAAAGTIYTITGYNGNTVAASADFAGAQVYAPLTVRETATLMTNAYWNVSPTPASVRSGWGTSNSTPPAEVTTGANASSGSSVNGLVPMTNPGSWQADGNLWVTDGSGASTWYYWIKPVDGVAQCINPAGLSVTNA